MLKTKIILVGGFLGTGKTSLLMRAGTTLAGRGIRVGFVTNDQGGNLVDTALLRGQNFAVTEVAHGCFCCHFPDLMTSIQQLQQTINPEVILAEPVGSCTDLMATVLRPLYKYHREKFSIAPLTVLMDPFRDTTQFDPDVEYLYRQQLSEGTLIGLSKIDLVSGQDVGEQVEHWQAQYPEAKVIPMSSFSGVGVDDWLDVCFATECDLTHALGINYDLYARAEARLGWLNTAGSVKQSRKGFSIIEWTETLFENIARIAAQPETVLAHVKMYLQTAANHYRVSMTDSGKPLVWDNRPQNDSVQEFEFVLNARVQLPAVELERIVHHALQIASESLLVECQLNQFECFSPLPPEPTFHISLKEIRH